MTDHINNIKFIKEMEKHEILYNFNLLGYSRKDLTEKGIPNLSIINIFSLADTYSLIFVSIFCILEATNLTNSQ